MKNYPDKIIGITGKKYKVNAGSANLVKNGTILYIIKNDKKKAILRIDDYDIYTSIARIINREKDYKIKIGETCYITNDPPFYDKLTNFSLGGDIGANSFTSFGLEKRRIFKNIP